MIVVCVVRHGDSSDLKFCFLISHCQCYVLTFQKYRDGQFHNARKNEKIKIFLTILDSAQVTAITLSLGLFSFAELSKQSNHSHQIYYICI